MNTKKLILGGFVAGIAVGAIIGVLFAPEKGMETRKKIAKAGEDLADGIKDKFGQVIDILIERIEKTEDKVTITVQDSGIGMSAEAIENIFEKNQHYTSNGTANEQGTGLGLMLVKDFIRMNKGSIRVESTIGVGTTFFIELPV